MKRKLFVTSAAAALLAGTVLAAAQGMQKESPGGAGGIDRGGQGQMQHQPQGQGQRDQDKGQQGQREQGKSQTTGQGEREQGKGMQGQREQSKTQREQSQGQREPGKETTGQGQREQGQAGQREQGKQAPSQREGGREGAQQGGGSVSFTAEQRTKIRQTVLQGGNAPRVNNVNFSLAVGTVVPQTVRVITVPEVIVEVHPQWRGFFYFIVGDEIIIVDRNHHIVAVFTV